MKKFLSMLCLAVALVASAPAQAANESRAFPPDNCTTGSPFMGFTGVAGSNTFCNSGQDVLAQAIPTCTNGQAVVYENNKFVCKTQANVPSCNPNEFLNFDGQTYTCKSTGVATCGNNQVLTFNGTSYFCVNKDASIPNCTSNQFLTYNGAYSCASVATLTVPTCASGQVLTGVGNNQMACVAQASSTASIAGCRLDHYQEHSINYAYGNHTTDYYFHMNPDGSMNGTTSNNFQTWQVAFAGVGQAPMVFVDSQTVPTGWQDSPLVHTIGPDIWGSTTGTCEQPIDGGTGSCFTCVNGSWIGQ